MISVDEKPKPIDIDLMGPGAEPENLERIIKNLDFDHMHKVKLENIFVWNSINWEGSIETGDSFDFFNSFRLEDIYNKKFPEQILVFSPNKNGFYDFLGHYDTTNIYFLEQELQKKGNIFFYIDYSLLGEEEKRFFDFKIPSSILIYDGMFFFSNVGHKTKKHMRRVIFSPTKNYWKLNEFKEIVDISSRAGNENFETITKGLRIMPEDSGIVFYFHKNEWVVRYVRGEDKLKI